MGGGGGSGYGTWRAGNTPIRGNRRILSGDARVAILGAVKEADKVPIHTGGVGGVISSGAGLAGVGGTVGVETCSALEAVLSAALHPDVG